MLTVPEAAARVRRNPETVRRWIRVGRLRAQKIGTQHLIEEADLVALEPESADVEVPGGWGVLPDGSAQPDWGSLVRRSRDRH